MMNTKSLKPVLAGSVRAASLSGVSALALVLAVSGPASGQVIDDQVNSGAVTVPGDEASPWQINGAFHVGDQGTGILTIEDGGVVEMTGAFGTTLGNAATGVGTVVISGTDGAGNASNLLSISGFTIGYGGQGTLIIEDGGVAESTNSGTGVTIGYRSTATGTATVTGTDGNGNASSWLNVGGFYVGSSGQGTLNVLDGGLVTSGSGWITAQAGSMGTVTVSGVNADGTASTWNAEGGPMAVGAAGRGVLLIEAGGIVKNFAGIIARAEGTTSEVTVTGTGSHWINGAGLTVGERGEGLLTVADGGLVSANSVALGAGGAGHGIVLVSGIDGAGNASTIESNGSVSVGSWSSGEMTIENGGQVISGSYGYIAANRDTTGTVLVSGTDADGNASSWSMAYDLQVGSQGTGTLTIAEGGAVNAGARVVIGGSATGIGEALVSGSDGLGGGSRLEAGDNITIGSSGVGTLTVAEGGTVSSGDGYIGYYGTGAGTLNIGAAAGAAAAGAGAFDVATLEFRDGDGTLVFNHTDADYVFGAGLNSDGDGTHRVEHAAGHTTLTGDGSGFTGLTTLSGGTLIVGVDGAGSLGGDIDVLASTLLGGSGTVGSPGSMVHIGGGAVLAPGNAIGTLTVAGDVTLAADSTYEVEIAGGGTIPGVHNDLLSVAGTATLEGGTVEVVTLDPATSYQDWQVYTIVTAEGGVSGQFLEALSQSAFITTQLTHNADNVVLGVGLINAPEPEPEPEPGPEPEPQPEPTPGVFPTVAGTYNQTQAAIGLDGLDQSSGSDALAVYNRLLMLSADDARQAFDLSSGEIHASGQHVISQTMGQFGRILQQQGAAGAGSGGNAPGAALANGPAAPTTAAVGAIDDAALLHSGTSASAWLTALGGRGTIQGDGNAATLDWWNAGLAGGYQAPVEIGSGSAFAGIGLGYVRSHGAVDARRSTHDADNFEIGVYGGWTDGAWSLSGALAYGASHIATERGITFAGLDRTAEARYWAHSVGISAEAAYGFDLGGGAIVAPLFTLDAGWSGHGGFTETGADALSLTGAAESWTRLDTGIGIGVSHVVPTETGQVTLEGRVVWEHAFASMVPSQTESLAGSPVAFTVRGPEADRDRFRLGAGIAWDISDEVTLRAHYDGVLSGGQSSHAGTVGFNVRF